MSHLIHVLEDDSSIGEILMYILEDAGYQVQMSASVESFFESFGKITTALFLLDVRLPDGDGRDVCRTIKRMKNYNSVPVILMSAHAELKKTVEDTKADDFIAKPFDIAELLHIVQKRLAQINAA